MRILHISNHREMYNGMVTDLACAQADLGHDVAICSGPGDFDDLLSRHKVRIFNLRIVAAVWSAPESFFGIWSAIKKFGPDVVHTHMIKVSLLTWPLAKLMKVPFVTCVHNSFSKYATLMGVGDLVITGCRAEVGMMASRGIPARKLRPILNGTIGSARQCDKQYLEDNDIAIRRPAVITACGLHPRKGVADLIAGFKMARKELPDLSLYVFGGGPHKDEYTALAFKDGPSNINFCGQVPVLRPFLEKADVFVLASLADPAPLVISEAREAGLAVIATDVPGIPELLEYGEAGILVKPSAPPEISKQLVLLFKDPGRLALWKEKSQLRIEHLNISRVRDETLGVYRDAINAKRSPPG
jgi:glycosyltransferase involved in cell wall biosynthesis